MNTKSKIYKGLKISNDINAVCKGRILQRLFNRLLGKTTRRFMR